MFFTGEKKNDREDNETDAPVPVISTVPTGAGNSQEVNSEPEPDTIEINIETVDGLSRFISAAEDVYADTLQFIEAAKQDKYRQLRVPGLAGDQVYSTLYKKLTALQELVDLCRYEVLPSEKDITDEQLEQMQVLYNEMIALRNHVIDTYSIASSATAAVGAAGLAEVVTAPIESDAPNDMEKETEEVAQTETPVDVSLDSGIVAAQRQAEDLLATVNDAQSDYSAPALGARAGEVGERGLSELAASAGRVEAIMEKLRDLEDSNEDISVLKLTIGKYQRVLTEIKGTVRSQVEALAKIQPEAVTANEDVVAKETTADDINGANEERPPVKNGTVDTSEHVENKDAVIRSVNSGEEPAQLIENEDTSADDVVGDTVRQRGALRVNPVGVVDGRVAIRVAKQALERIAKMAASNNPKKVTDKKAELPVPRKAQQANRQTEPVKSDLPPAETAALAHAEQKDPINKLVPQTGRKSESPVVEPSWTKEYLSRDDRLGDFVKNYFPSPAAFEQALLREVSRLEASTIGRFDKWLNEMQASPFDYLKEMTLAQIDDLANLPHSEIKMVLAGENIKYETFVFWLDSILEMQQVVGFNPDMKFGELYIRYVIESELERLEAEVKV